jgi:hypothetical protein
MFSAAVMRNPVISAEVQMQERLCVRRVGWVCDNLSSIEALILLLLSHDEAQVEASPLPQ